MAADCAPFVKKGTRFLDLGCGSGIISREFEKKFGLDLVGVDIIDNRIIPIKFQLYDGKTLPFDDGGFDTVLISYVLHHANEPVRLLKEAKRVLKAGGRIIVFEDLYQGSFAKLICGIHGGTYGALFERGKGKGVCNFKTEKQWEDIFRALGLKPIFGKRVSTRLNPVNKHLFILENSC